MTQAENTPILLKTWSGIKFVSILSGFSISIYCNFHEKEEEWPGRLSTLLFSKAGNKPTQQSSFFSSSAHQYQLVISYPLNRLSNVSQQINTFLIGNIFNNCIFNYFSCFLVILEHWMNNMVWRSKNKIQLI